MIFSTTTLNQTPLDWEGNTRRILDAVHGADREGTNLLLLPELAISGFGARNHFRRKDVAQAAEKMLEKIVENVHKTAVLLGFPLEFREKTYNATAWVSEGKIEFVHCKTRLMQRYFPEKMWFEPWKKGRIESHRILEKTVPIGDFTQFQRKLPGMDRFFHFRLEIGEECDPLPPEEEADCVDIYLHPCASPFSFGKHRRRIARAAEISRKRNCVYVFSNLLGCESGQFLYDGGAILAENGEILSQTRRFSYEDMEFISSNFPNVGPGKPVKKPAEKTVEKKHEIFSEFEDTKEEEFARAIPLGLFDYMRKSRSRGFVLSLSGGADSGAIAVLVFYMVHFAWNQLSRDVFLEKLDFIPGIQDCKTPEEAVFLMLCCVYQQTKNSGETTQKAARDLSRALNADFFQINLDSILGEYFERIASNFPREITWEKDDLALQNIQARARVPAVWFLANLRNALLLNTGNRSEATLGYTTTDGDTCGGLAPIGGIDKAYLRTWLRWAERIGPVIGGKNRPLPALQGINEQHPTAELRPPDSRQTDESDLMPYEVLDRFEKRIIRDRLCCEEAAKKVYEDFPQYESEQVEIWARRFYRLWIDNQWKRKRYALNFHLDEETLDPEDWNHFPVLHG